MGLERKNLCRTDCSSAMICPYDTPERPDGEKCSHCEKVIEKTVGVWAVSDTLSDKWFCSFECMNEWSRIQIEASMK